MSAPSGGAGLRTAWRVLVTEGPAAFRDRWLDRLAARWRRRRFDAPAPDALEPPAPVLNLLPTPPRPDFGGVQTQLLRRLEAEAAERSTALLYPDAGGYRLELRAGDQRSALAFSGPAAPASPLVARDRAFEQVVAQAAHRAGARTVHLESVLGLPLESLLALCKEGLRIVVSLHDFGAFCPRPHLVERPQEAFCHFSRDPPRCRRCLGHDWPVEEGWQERRRSLAAELLRRAEAVVYPSPYLRRTFGDLVPGLEREWVVEPASLGAPLSLPERRSPRGRHVAYVGSVQTHKGAGLFEEVVSGFDAAAFPDLRWSVYGGGDAARLARLRRLPGVRVRGYYRAGSLPALLRRDGVDVALLLSIWPETYGMTLDECWRAGVPALALDHGAPAERIGRWGGGALVDPAAGAEGVAEGLGEMLGAAGRPRVSEEALRSLPTPETAARGTLELYRSLGLLGAG